MWFQLRWALNRYVDISRIFEPLEHGNMAYKCGYDNNKPPILGMVYTNYPWWFGGWFLTLLYQYYMLMRRLYIPLQLRSSVTQLGTTSQAHLVDHCYSLAPGPIASRPATNGDRVLNGNFLGSLNGGTLVPYFKPYLERNITIYCLTWPEMLFLFSIILSRV